MKMYTSPLVSVVMSVYNEPIDWLEKSVDSILNQTYKNLEFIIICDNPLNINLINFLSDKASHDSRICLVVNEQNLGLTKSLNIAVRRSKGKYIARMDADDISVLERIEKEVDCMESNKKIDVVATGCIKFYEDGHENVYSGVIDYNQIVQTIFFANPIIHPSVMIRRTSVDTASLYDEFFLKSQDYELWLRLIMERKFFYIINESLIKYRVSTQQISQKYGDIQKMYAEKAQEQALKKYFNLIGFHCEINSVDLKCMRELYNRILEKGQLSILDRSILFYLMYVSLNKFSFYHIFIESIFIYKFSPKQLFRLLKKKILLKGICCSNA